MDDSAKTQPRDSASRHGSERAEAGRSAAPILVVDDQPASLLALLSVLEPLGQTLVQAHSGEEALRHVLAQDFAVILMDVRMPDLDGLNTAQFIRRRERSAKVPIIFLTAAPIETAEIFRAYDQGAVDFLLKPCDPHILRSKVRVFVDLYLKEEMIKRQAALLMQRDREAFARRGEMRFRALIDSMPIGVLAIRPNGMVYYWNRTVAEYLGKPPGEAPESSPLEIVAPEDRDNIEALWDNSLRRGRPFETQFRMRRASDGVDRWHICRGVPEQDDDRAITTWIWTVTDINHHYEAREEAEAANRAKDEFLATVSHELRNPLTAILGWARLLQSGKLDSAKTARALDIVVNNAQSQAALIEDLLDVSRTARGKLDIKLAPVDMVAVIAAALAAARPLAEARKIALEEQLEAGAGRAIRGDASRLEQVVSNLLSNAIKFTPEGGRVSIRLRQDESHVELSVADTGRGIRREFLPLIFQRFRQADAGASRNSSGLGLGLAISRELVQLHDGTIEAHSEGEGKGATFTVRLPLYFSFEAGANGPEREEHDEKSLFGITVLLVDDDADTREMMVEVLSNNGAKTIPVSSAREALNALRNFQPDVLISDIGMPFEDGYSLIRRIRSLEPEQGGQIPACALTGWSSAAEHERAISAGFQLHVTKPADPQRLIAAVHSLASGKPVVAPVRSTASR